MGGRTLARWVICGVVVREERETEKKKHYPSFPAPGKPVWHELAKGADTEEWL